jgi:hypothetical protein
MGDVMEQSHEMTSGIVEESDRIIYNSGIKRKRLETIKEVPENSAWRIRTGSRL